MPKTPDNKREITISTNTIIKIIAIVAVVYALWWIKNIILIILTSVVLASFVHAGARRLKKFKVPRSVAVVIIYLLAFAVITFALWLFVPVFIDELVALAQLMPENTFLSNFVNAFENGNGVRDLIGGISSGSQTPLEVVGQLRNQISAGGVFQSIAAFFGGIVNFVLVLVISFYLSMEEKATDQFLRVVTPLRHEEYVIGLWHRTRSKIGSWFKGQLMLAAILAVLTYIGLLIIGVPYALMLAVVAALLGLVPYGIILGTVPALLIAYLASNDVICYCPLRRSPAD
jgi:predicted PurR-regulated permease PerM